MSADEVTRMFLPRKGPQRTNSSSSLASTTSSSSNSTVSSSSPNTNGAPPTTNGQPEGWIHRKKAARGLVSAALDTRPQSLTVTPSSQSTASAMSTIHQPSPILPSQGLNQAQQQTANRTVVPGPNEPHAVLVLLPVNGTFERKQITIPFFPELLRIGRQTNAKTVPTPVNGFFDSKVLSRQHAEVWADRNGKIWIRDVKSSNGTFVNGNRLSLENKESEPHGLQEHDMLELGIDIVSEDQKSIVHHKVSAKVEHAGIVNNGSSVLDLNFGDIDPASGGGLMGPPFPQHMPQSRGRGGSLGSTTGNGRGVGPNGVVGMNMNGPLAQRQMNSWLSPITIEQVVKKLTVSCSRESLTMPTNSIQSELKQAKNQSQDLHRTGDYFSVLFTQGSGQIPLKTSLKDSSQESQMNGILHPVKLDSMSPFSQPPAPPPQQPLPEKPDTSRSVLPDHNGQYAFKRTEPERPGSSGNFSPSKSEASSVQILSLVEALTSAKRQIDSQGDRVKQLEDLLRQERKARESAEERTRRLLETRPRASSEAEKYSAVEDTFNPHIEDTTISSRGPSEDSFTQDTTSCSHKSDEVRNKVETLQGSSIRSREDEKRDNPEVDTSASQIQQKLDNMMREMDEMKLQMEKYRRRAEGAEDEKNSLVEIVKRIRSGEDKTINTTGSSPRRQSTEMATQTDGCNDGKLHGDAVSAADPNASTRLQPSQQNGTATEHLPNIHDLQKAISSTLAYPDYQQGKLVQCAPYASMLGVVLIGVGIMTYLNSWQKVDR